MTNQNPCILKILYVWSKILRRICACVSCKAPYKKAGCNLQEGTTEDLWRACALTVELQTPLPLLPPLPNSPLRYMLTWGVPTRGTAWSTTVEY